ncbi:hypothetical protein [Mesorhizobium sp. M0676]|uniref:hypothetical protein n=1 Tax=Mesorhizobium sp. M0676 TaxID=2956984 RepID=UPI00333D7E87
MMGAYLVQIGLASLLALGTALQSAIAAETCVRVSSLASPAVPPDPSSEGGLSTFTGKLDCGLVPGGIACLSKDSLPFDQALAALKEIASAAARCAGAKRHMFYANSVTAVVAMDGEPEIIVALNEAGGPESNSFHVREFIRRKDDATGTADAPKASIAPKSEGGANGAGLATSAKVPPLPCDQLKEVLSKNDKLFEALRGPTEDVDQWTANLQLGGWQDCYIALLDPNQAYFTCKSGPFALSEQIIAGIEVVKIDVGACLGSDWQVSARTDHKKRAAYTFERAVEDPSVEIRQSQIGRNKDWWISLDVTSPTP